MKQNEEKWVEFENSMEDVITRSGLDKSILFDIRGKHANFEEHKYCSHTKKVDIRGNHANFEEHKYCSHTKKVCRRGRTQTQGINAQSETCDINKAEVHTRSHVLIKILNKVYKHKKSLFLINVRSLTQLKVFVPHQYLHLQIITKAPRDPSKARNQIQFSHHSRIPLFLS